MELGNFSVSLAVQDIEASRLFYQKLGFAVFMGDQSQNWLIMKNGDHAIGLFQGMFDKNILTFNPGWGSNSEKLSEFTDVRELQRQLKDRGVTMVSEADESTTGPANFMVVDPDGNTILVDQHVKPTAVEMNRLTLQFEPELERTYQHAMADRFRLQARVSGVAGSLNLIGIGLWFLLLVPETDGGPLMGRIFLLSAIPTIFSLAMTFNSMYPQRRGPMAATGILGTGLLLATIALQVPGTIGGTVTTVSVIVVLLFSFVFIPGGIAWTGPVGMLTALVAVVAVGLSGLDWVLRSAYWLGIVSAVFGAGGAGYFVEYYIRRDFLTRRQLDAERQRSDRLLLNVLPPAIATRLKAGEEPIADAFPETTVLFADIVDFTGISSKVSPDDMVQTLNVVFSTFDRLAAEHGLEKIKTIGDAYMVVGGLPEPRADHAEAVAEMALAMQASLEAHRGPTGEPIKVRVGINTGPVVAGVIGTAKFAYDLWGDAVNTASRMESHGVPDGIQVTESTYQRLRDRYCFEARGVVDVKGKGPMQTYLLTGRR
jgi:class 3 adenylate cyclase/predicted enzyme related to lactoylglutathione lyase